MLIESPLVRLSGDLPFSVRACLSGELCLVEHKWRFSLKMLDFLENRPNSAQERIGFKAHSLWERDIPVLRTDAIAASEIRDNLPSKKRFFENCLIAKCSLAQ